MSTPQQSPAQPVIPVPAFVYNHDVVALANRLGRFVTELTRSNSANVGFMSAADTARLLSYLKNVDDLLLHVNSQPVLDLPKTGHSVQWPVEPLDTIPAMDNEDVEDLVRLVSVAHAEILNSDSSRSASSLIKFDSDRLTAIVDKARQFVTKFVAANNPIDLPASSPMDPVTASAKLS